MILQLGMILLTSAILLKPDYIATFPPLNFCLGSSEKNLKLHKVASSFLGKKFVRVLVSLKS